MNLNTYGNTPQDASDSKRVIGWVLVVAACVIVICALAMLFLRSSDGLALADTYGDQSSKAGKVVSPEELSLGNIGGEIVLEAGEEFRSAVEEAIEDSESEKSDTDEVLRSSRSDAIPEAPILDLDITKDLRSSFIHGEKPAQYQKYIVLHDTEGSGTAQSVVNWWDSNGKGVAAHFVINKDGSIVQCVDMDKITHHAGYGDTGHNALFGVEDESRDDMVGTTPIGSWAADYGMNSYSIGIELVHVGGEGDYPEAQLRALDGLIAYIDSYYGFESRIIDHKDWRSGNSDTSPEFAKYFENYKTYRKHA